MSRPLPRRLMIGAVLGTLLVGLMVIIGLRLTQPAMQRAAITNQVRGIDHDACVAAPSSWGWKSGDLSFFAYDRAGRSANRNAPAIDQTLLQRALSSNEAAIENKDDTSTFVVPVRPEGPCAVLRLTSRNPAGTVAPRLLAVLAGSIVIALLLAVLATVWLVVRPLRTRIEGLAMAAEGVGSDQFSPQSGGTDALGHIADVLARSHDRIVDTRDALERRNRALEDHLAGIAHDLRTPLSSMHLAMEAVAAESDGPLRDEARRALADVVYLSSMVENLHQGTRLRHEVDVSSGGVELSDLVRRLERRYVIVGRHTNVDVAASTPEREVWVACTPALAERAVANLIQNSVEHNSKPGHVAITLTVDDTGTQFELTVADDGPGLPKETLASLEDETFLRDTARRRGPGLGMLITAEVARRAGWSVSYESLEPTGLRVRIQGDIDVASNERIASITRSGAYS